MLLTHRTLLLPLLFGISLVLTGCGGGGDNTPPLPQNLKENGIDNTSYEERLESGDLRRGAFVMRSDGPKSFDPIRGSTVYENRMASQVYETLVQYKYLKRPFELEPLLLEEMPKVSEDGATFSFKLKKGVHFQDDACFPDGIGREMVASDVIYSWKRMADLKSNSKVWWIVKDTIEGFDAYYDEQNAEGNATFDYEKDVAGLRIKNDYEFDVTLSQPSQRFMWTLAMFQMAVVPREAVEEYGDKFGRHPVGTGPFVMKEEDWESGVRITFRRNPKYHECYYPEECMEEDRQAYLHIAAGKRLPLLDEVEVRFMQQDEPMWLEFKSDNIDYCQVPSEYYEQIFNKRTGRMLKEPRSEGLRGVPVPLLDFIFRGFNMEDELLGGYTEEKRALRQAICIALDWDEQNETFYNGLNIVYDGPVPPALPGHPEGHKHPKSFRGPDLDRAKELLAKAGYPGGKGLPKLEYYSSRGRNNTEQSEMLSRQLGEIGIEVDVNLVDFSTLIQKVDNKNAPFFSFAWGSDYPDAENNLQLFYGPNEAPGSNHFNYKNEEYDKLYEQILIMPPSDERTNIVERMVEILLEDCPYAGSMARTRHYLIKPRMKFFKPVETFENWFKYVYVAPR